MAPAVDQHHVGRSNRQDRLLFLVCSDDMLTLFFMMSSNCVNYSHACADGGDKEALTEGGLYSGRWLQWHLQQTSTVLEDAVDSMMHVPAPQSDHITSPDEEMILSLPQLREWLQVFFLHP